MLAYEYIKRNKRRSLILAALFPISFTLFAFLIIFFIHSLGTIYYYVHSSIDIVWSKLFSASFMAAHEWCKIVLPICFALSAFWARIAIKDGGKFVLEYIPGISPILKLDHFDAFTTLENLCLTAGMPMPDLYELNDDSLNAFATGYNPQNAALAVTRGLMEKLTPMDLQGVVAHEMAHIGNRDIRLNLLIITGLGVFYSLGRFCLRCATRSSGRNDKKGNGGILLICIAIAFLIFNLIVAPLIHLAISRRREYVADATGAKILHNSKVLADALEKIAVDSTVEVLVEQKNMAVACIASPFAGLSNLTSTHPSIEERVRRLRNM